MTIFKTATPSGHSIFCDDVRIESNGKLMYIGIYNGDMLIDTMPALLAQFRVVINYIESKGESDMPVRFVVTIPRESDDEIIFDLTAERPDLAALPVADVPDDDVLVRSTIHAAFSPLPVTHPGRLKVRAYRGEDEIRLGTLRIRLKSEWKEEMKQLGQKEAAN